MTNLEPNALTIVGCERDKYLHIAKADSKEQIVTIVHSEECLKEFEDLRECPFSLSLDAGITEQNWKGYEDRAVVSEIDVDGSLVPFPLASMRVGIPFSNDRATSVQQKLNESTHQ